MENFIFGGVAAGLSIFVVNPIDVVKSRMQVQGEGGGGPRAYPNTFSALRSIAAKEGVIKGLYRGIAPAICFQMTGNSIRFGVYYYGKQLLGADKEVDSQTNLALALTAGGLAGLLACPFFTLKTQLQIQSSASDSALKIGHQHSHTGMLDAAGTIMRSQGVPGFFPGLPVFFTRCVVLVGAQMTSYDRAKASLRDAKVLDEGPALHFASSLFAAGVACVCMQPFDLVGSRMMNQPVSPAGKGLLYHSPIDCFSKTISNEGFFGLYKGVGANYLRMGPQYILTFMFFEQLMRLSNEFKQGRETQQQPSSHKK